MTFNEPNVHFSASFISDSLHDHKSSFSPVLITKSKKMVLVVQKPPDVSYTPNNTSTGQITSQKSLMYFQKQQFQQQQHYSRIKFDLLKSYTVLPCI